MIADAIHLVADQPAAGHVLAAGGRRSRIRYADSRLTVGPCDPDPTRHRARRLAWEAQRPFPLPVRLPGVDDLRAAIAGDAPVAVWATRAFEDLVWLFWALDALDRVAAHARRLLLVRPHAEDPLTTVGGLGTDGARDAFEAATPIVDETRRAGADLWRRYASPSPAAFDETRRAGSAVFPELTDAAAMHGAWFPRLEDGRLHLSQLDATLLRLVGDDLRRAGELLEDGPPALLWPFGGYHLLDRLRAWASHGALARETHVDDNPWLADSYALDDRGRRLLAEGLGRVDDAPPLYIGGCLVNDPSAPWARVPDGDGWRLLPLGDGTRTRP